MAESVAGSMAAPVPYIRLADARGKWVLAITVGGSAVAQLEATVVNVALPAIDRDLDAGVAGLQWVLNGYLLTLAALILLGGSLGDRYGRRRLFVIGVVWFTLASLLCGLAPTIELLVVARILQGIGGALLTPGSLAIIEASFAPEDRGKAIGAWSGLGGVAAAIGPLVGGWLVDSVSWRWVFVINVPLGVVVALGALRHVPETRDTQAQGRDATGSLLVTTGLAGATYALIDAGGGLSPAGLVAGVIGVAFLVSFVFVERRVRTPMLPLSIFASRQFTAANLVTFVVYGAMSGVFFLLVVQLQIALGYSALAAGAASLPITVIMLLFAAQGGALAQRIGPRLPLTVGPLILAAAMLIMLRIQPGTTYWTTVFPAVVLFGVGLVFVVAPVTATALAAAEDRYAGVASGVNNAVARTAALITVAALPLVVGLTDDVYGDAAELTDAFELAMLVTAVMAALGGVIAWFTIRDDVLPAAEPHEHDTQFRHCAVGAPPQRTAESQCESHR